MSYNHKQKEEKMNINIHELASEVKITGGTEYYNGNIIIGPIAESSQSDLNCYNIKLIENNSGDYNFDVSKSNKKEYYHLEGTSGEFADLLSLYFHARFYRISTTYGKITKNSCTGRVKYKNLISQPQKHIDEDIFAEKTDDFFNFQKFLEKIEKIPEKYHRAIIASAHNYNLALKEIGIDHEMVFVRLVSAIENFSKDYKLDPKEDPLTAQKAQQCLESLSDTEIQEINAIFINRKTIKKFEGFIKKYSSGYFQQLSVLNRKTISTENDLGKIAKTVYDARSEYLHNGEHMYLSEEILGFKFDADSSHGKYIGYKKFDIQNKLPRIGFFEGLVRHCILNKIDELSGTIPK
jgi:hypothetical protein